MANPFSAKKKAKEKKANPFGRKKPVEKTDEITPGPDGMYGIQIPADESSNPWTRKKAKARTRAGVESDKQDYVVDGLRICHVREHDGFWTIEVVNNDETVRFDNKTIHPWGLTLGDRAKEPAPFLVPILQERWYQELHRQGRKTPLELHTASLRAPMGKKKDNGKSKAEKPKKSAGKKGKTNPFGRKKAKAK